LPLTHYYLVVKSSIKSFVVNVFEVIMAKIQYHGLELPSDPARPIYTFGFVKPHAFGRREQILADIEYFSRYHSRRPLVVLKDKSYQISREEAEQHYREHRARPFFRMLVDMICEGPVHGFVLAGEDAIPSFRNLLGSSEPSQWKPFQIRHRYGEPEKGKAFNAVHASDGVKSFVHEVELHFDRKELDEFFWASVEQYKEYLDSL
jgi:nucleoside-diphosphate kinase